MYGSQDSQGGLNANPPAVPVSSSTANGPSQELGQSYAAYPNAGDSYAYGGANYQGYNYGYLQQQGNLSLPQNAGAYENSAAPYQPVSSFQNTNSYTESTPYQNYYNAGAYQNTGAYQTTGYSGPSWSGNNYTTYNTFSGYQGYTSSEASGTPHPQTTSTQPQYPHGYQQQWADYYASFPNYLQTDLEDTHAPGTEPDTPNNFNNFRSSSVQPPPPGIQSTWQTNEGAVSRPDSQASIPAAMEISSGNWVSNDNCDLKQSPRFQHQSYLQPNLHEQPAWCHQDQEKNQLMKQGQYVQDQPVQLLAHATQFPVPELTSNDASGRKMGKMQIPNNPRIAPTLGFGTMPLSKVKPPVASLPQRPAYITVAANAVSKCVSSADDVADAMLKPGMFPHSLRAYVERALSRCKDEMQKVACQNIMKEMITKASIDGSLFTKDWDTEPLFPLPSVTAQTTGKEFLQSADTVVPTVKVTKSPLRRSKSRWEPVADEKADNKQEGQTHDIAKGAWAQLNECDASISSVRWEKQEGIWNKKKLSLQQQLLNMRKPIRAVKKARKDSTGTSDGGDDSSGESDDEPFQVGGIHLRTLGATETPEETMKRQFRTRRFDGEKEANAASKGLLKAKVGLGASASASASASARRATALLLAKSYGEGGGAAVEDINWDALTVKGTCQEVEKKYLRLTSAPDPSTVRPEDVLRKALVMVQKSQKSYLYKCEQLKSIRQDLTVQRIRNAFTAEVYETHARIALEAGDLPEYNQCQSQLKGLYAEGIKGCCFEFSAYNLLYIIVQRGSNRDLLSSMARLSAEAKEDDGVKHALAVRSAIAAGNYTSFFRLYRIAPNLNTCLMDIYVERIRFDALKCMSRSYRPTLPVSFIARTLGFTGLEGAAERESESIDECEEWLRAHGAQLIVESGLYELQLDCKASVSSLFMPEPDDAVAHGDVNLAINDFFAQS